MSSRRMFRTWHNYFNRYYLHVTLMGMGAFLGGMMTLTPE